MTEKDKLYITAWYAIANLDYSEAVAVFRSLIAQYPLEVEAYQRLGLLLASEERWEEATEVLKQGLVVDNEASDICNALGGVYSSLGRHNEAIAMHQRYVALAPEEPNAHDSLGMSYQWAGQYQLASAEYDRALALNPQFDVARVHLANTDFQEGHYREAIEQYQKYIQNAPSDLERARGYDYIARVYLKRGDLVRAEASARKAMSYDKHQFSSSLFVALAQGNMARAKSFRELFESSHNSHRGRRLPKRHLYVVKGLTALKSGIVTETIENLKQALGHYPPFYDIDAYEDCLANAYLSLGQLDEAISEYKRILQLNPNYPLAHYHLAQVYERKGQREQARAECQRFLEIWKDADADIPEVVAAKKQLSTRS